MLRQTVQFLRQQIKQEEEKKRQEEEINEICQDIRIVEQKIKDLEVEIDKLKNSLPLKKMIKGFYKIKGKTPEEINILNALLVKHKEQKSALALDENASQTVLNVNTIKPLMAPMSQVSSDTSEQIVDGSSLLQQIQRVQLKQVAKNKVENGSPVFVINPNDLAGVKLKSVDPKNSVTSSHDERKPTEYEKKFAEIQAYNKEINNIVPSQTNDKSSEKWENLLEVLCNDYLTPEEINSKHFFEIQEKIFSGDFNEEESQEFSVYARNKMAAKEFIERPNRSLSLIRDFSESRPTSMMFDKTLRPFQTDLSALEQNKPVIVGEIPKLKV